MAGVDCALDRRELELAPEQTEDNLETEALMRNVRDQFQKVAELVPSVPGELTTAVLGMEDPRQLVYTIATYQRTLAAFLA